jgi:hypothetical protein
LIVCSSCTKASQLLLHVLSAGVKCQFGLLLLLLLCCEPYAVQEAALLVVALLLRPAPQAACRALRRFCCGGCPSTYWRHRWGVTAAF